MTKLVFIPTEEIDLFRPFFTRDARLYLLIFMCFHLPLTHWSAFLSLAWTLLSCLRFLLYAALQFHIILKAIAFILHSLSLRLPQSPFSVSVYLFFSLRKRIVEFDFVTALISFCRRRLIAFRQEFSIPGCGPASWIWYHVRFAPLSLMVDILNQTLDLMHSRDMSSVLGELSPYFNNIGPTVVTVLCLVVLSLSSAYLF